MPEHVGAVVVAGGSGHRFGGPVPKQFLPLRGVPVLLWAVRAFTRHPRIRSVVVVLPPAHAADPPEWLASEPVIRVPGGAERTDSVWNGLNALPPECNPVLVHDGARPLVSAEVISAVIDGARGGGAIAALPVADTLKRARADQTIARTEDRTGIWSAQTPQGFPREILAAAYRAARGAGIPATDDAEVVERAGGTVRLVLGSPANLKITQPEDLRLAEALAIVFG